MLKELFWIIFTKKINMENQIKLLKKYNIKNYTIENDKITINYNLDLSSLTIVDKDFLKGTTIIGDLYLNKLTSIDKISWKELLLMVIWI